MESELPYLTAFQCGLAMRSILAEPQNRFDVASTAAMGPEVKRLIEKHLAKSGTGIPASMVPQLCQQLGHGLGLQLRSMPIAIHFRMALSVPFIWHDEESQTVNFDEMGRRLSSAGDLYRRANHRNARRAKSVRAEHGKERRVAVVGVVEEAGLFPLATADARLGGKFVDHPAVRRVNADRFLVEVLSLQKTLIARGLDLLCHALQAAGVTLAWHPAVPEATSQTLFVGRCGLVNHVKAA